MSAIDRASLTLTLKDRQHEQTRALFVKSRNVAHYCNQCHQIQIAATVSIGRIIPSPVLNTVQAVCRLRRRRSFLSSTRLVAKKHAEVRRGESLQTPGEKD